MQKINQWIAEQYLKIAKRYTNLETIECEKIVYVIKSILGELEKTIMLWSLFWLLGTFKFCLMGTACIVSMRIFLGGTHRNTYWGCFAFSCAFFQIAYILSQRIVFQKHFFVVVWMVYVFFILLVAPLQSEKKPNLTRNTRRRLKLGSLCMLSGWVTFCWICKSEMGNYVIWLLILQMLEIIRVKGGQKVCEYISQSASID